MMYKSAKHFLKGFPILKNINNPIIMRQIAILLEPEIFLANDYIVYKDDIGDEMFFITTGRVNVLSTNEERVLVSLGSGYYFGEIALFTSGSKRMCSVVAEKVSQLYILKKSNLEKIFHSFPVLE